jgi:glutamate synthase domain-containing protein 1
MRQRNEKDISGCAIAGLLSESGARFNGETVIRMITNMHDRSNGLGGGFAAYGIYPDRPEAYALHLMYDRVEAQAETEAILERRCEIQHAEPIPTRPVEAIRNRPILHRYFVRIRPQELETYYDLTEDDLLVQLVMAINADVEGAFVFSSGRNMGVFKGVGFPEDIGAFFRLDDYEAYSWIAHGRFPTNTTGWWGGAHPFGLLDWAIVHNGEISSYGINRRYLANFGYDCALQTDTEVIAYLFDLLLRKHALPLEAACMAMAPPFWSQIARMPAERRRTAQALLNGPFSVLVGHAGGIIGFNDRIKLRPMVAARRDDMLYIASEEASIREVCRRPEQLWHAQGGVPIIGEVRSPTAQDEAVA